MPTPRTALIGLLLLTLAGCGGSSSSAGGASPSASPAPPPTKEAATAAAGAINLTQADVGAAYKASPAQKDPSTDAEAAALATCVGGTPPSAALVDLSSPDFAKGAALQMQQLSSSVSVLPSEDQVRTDVAALTGDKAVPCLTKYIGKVLAASGGGQVTFESPKVTPLETRDAGTDGAFGYDVKVSAKSSGITIDVDVVLQGFAVKHTEVQLTALSIGPAFPEAERSKLLSALLQRAEAKAV